MIAAAWLIAGCIAVPLLVFSIECIAGIPQAGSADEADDAPPYEVLIPAHNEAAGIGRTIAAVREQLRPCDRVLVIADNCTDTTAEVARWAGAAVCTRTNPARAGKAYALAFGRDVLHVDPPSVVIVIDADCIPQPGALARLAATASRHDAAVQARNLLSWPVDASPLVRISTFAFRIKNLVRQRGLFRLSGSALLQGTGMAFPWPMFAAAPLASASLVEDMRLGLELSLAGERVMFDDHAHVLSPAASQGATRSQRTRWEHGALTTAAQYLPRVLAAGILGRPRLLMLSADLTIPPVALLVTAAAAAMGVLALIALLTGAVLPLLLLTGVGIIFATTLGIAWHAHGRDVLPVAALRQLPRYLLWKQPIYARIIGTRQRSWVRTSRQP